MVENLGVYLRNDKVEWKAALPGSTTNGGFMKKVTLVDWPTDDGNIKITLMQGVELKSHLQGLAGFVQQSTHDIELQQEALAFVSGVQLCLGVQFPGPIDEEGPIVQRLKNVAGVHGGALFVSNSLLKDGRYIAGERSEPNPATIAEPAAMALATVQLDPAEMQFATEAPPLVRIDRRARTLAHLEARGFRSATSLPIGEIESALRPAEEIAACLGAISLAYLWCVAPRVFVPDEELQAAARAADVADGHTPKTQTILSTDREQAQHQFGTTIGWSLENLWSLAWVLGFDHEIEIDSGMIGDEPSIALRSWMPIHGRTMTSILSHTTPRTADEVADREDIFYCAHNAVRSAQAGELSTIPEGFDPLADGGTVHERRHGLTWSLSPGVAWDDTDLST